MALYNANLIIRETRKAKGITQEQLAEGICSRETIVKLEKGTRKPNWFVFREITRRLGLEGSIAQDEISSEEEVVLYRRIMGCYNLINTQKFDDAKAEIDKIDAEKSAVWKKGVWYESLLRLKVAFYTYGINSSLELNKYKNPALAIEYALECLELTRPGFDVGKISEYFLATHEFQTIRRLAMASAATDADAAIKIYQDLRRNAENPYFISTSDPIKTVNAEYRLVLLHLSNALSVAGRHEECLQIAEEGLARFSIGNDSPLNFMNLLSLKSAGLEGLGRIEESMEASKKGMLLHYVFDGYNDINFAASKKYHEETVGEKLDLSVPW